MARLAGVSVGTASNVLQGKGNLHSGTTATKVQDAAKALGYRRNAVARSLVQRHTRTLGVVLEPFHGRLTANTYLTSVVDGFLEFAVAGGYQLKIVTLLRSDYDYVVSQVDDASVDGVLLVAPLSDSAVLRWADVSGVPAVVAGSILPGVRMPCVDVDDEPAFHQLTSMLVALGHHRIGLIAGPAHQFSAVRREQGYRRALADHFIRPDAEWRIQGDYTAESGRRGVSALAEVRPRVTAIVCSNDGVALSALERLAEMDVRVPDDVSVVGFDGADLGQYSTPPLTTMRQPTHAIGMRAAELLIQEIQTGRRSAKVHKFLPELVARASVGPAPEAAR